MNDKQTVKEVRALYGCGLMDAKHIVERCGGYAHIIAYYAPRKGQAVVRKPSLEQVVADMVATAIAEDL